MLVINIHDHYLSRRSCPHCLLLLLRLLLERDRSLCFRGRDQLVAFNLMHSGNNDVSKASSLTLFMSFTAGAATVCASTIAHVFARIFRLSARLDSLFQI